MNKLAVIHRLMWLVIELKDKLQESKDLHLHQ